MDDWEKYADEELVAVAQGANQSDDAEDDIPDSWEDAMNSDSEDSKPSTPTSAPKKKRNLNQILAERKAAEEKKAAELAKKKMEEENEMNEDPAERKARMEKAIKESDFENAADLFRDVSISDKNNAAPVSSGPQSLSTMVPTNKAQFEEYAKLIVDRVDSFNAKNTLLVPFLEKLFRDLAEPLDFSDIRKLSSMLSTLSNDKQRAEKDKKGGKKTKKAQIRVESSSTASFTMDERYEDSMNVLKQQTPVQHLSLSGLSDFGSDDQALLETGIRLDDDSTELRHTLDKVVKMVAEQQQTILTQQKLLSRLHDHQLTDKLPSEPVSARVPRQAHVTSPDIMDRLKYLEERVRELEKQLQDRVTTHDLAPVLEQLSQKITQKQPAPSIPLSDKDLATTQKRLGQLEEEVSRKLDAASLDEFSRHVVMRNELGDVVDRKTIRAVGKCFKMLDAPKQNGNDLDSSLQETVKAVKSRLDDCMDKHFSGRMQDVSRVLFDFVESHKSKEDEKSSEPQQAKTERNQRDTKNMSPDVADMMNQLTEEFDEKLFILSSKFARLHGVQETSTGNLSVSSHHWIWKPTRSLSSTMLVPWTSNANVPEMFEWDSALPSIIQIQQTGYYLVSVAFFTKTRPKITLLINDKPVVTGFYSPTYVVYHGQSSEGVEMAGVSIQEWVHVERSCTLSVAYQGKSSDQGLLRIELVSKEDGE